MTTPAQNNTMHGHASTDVGNLLYVDYSTRFSASSSYRLWYSEKQKYVGLGGVYLTGFNGNTEFIPDRETFGLLDTGEIVEYTECRSIFDNTKCNWNDAIYLGTGRFRSKGEVIKRGQFNHDRK